MLHHQNTPEIIETTNSRLEKLEESFMNIQKSIKEEPKSWLQVATTARRKHEKQEGKRIELTKLRKARAKYALTVVTASEETRRKLATVPHKYIIESLQHTIDLNIEQ